MIRTSANEDGRVFRILVCHEQLGAETIKSHALTECEEVNPLVRAENLSRVNVDNRTGTWRNVILVSKKI
jgi:hypothetical protein